MCIHIDMYVCVYIYIYVHVYTHCFMYSVALARRWREVLSPRLRGSLAGRLRSIIE